MRLPVESVPEWLLERLATDELPEEQAQALRKRLELRGELGRLSGLAGSNAEILAAYPPEQIVPAIKGRTVESERKAASIMRRPSRSWWAWSLATACAASLVTMLVLHEGVEPSPGAKNQMRTSARETQEEASRSKGLAPSLRLYRKTMAGSEPIRPGALVRKGETLQVRYVAAGKRFGVIASVDARGTITLHLPEAPGQATALERDGERALPHAFELDDSPGFERFHFVTSDAPFSTEDVTPALRSNTPLPAQFSLFALALKKEVP